MPPVTVAGEAMSGQGDWADNDDLTEPAEVDDTPLMGVTGGEMARPGDWYVLEFLNDGEEVPTEQGIRAQFKAELIESSFNPQSGDNNRIEEGDEISLMTGSARFLKVLKGHLPVAGDQLKITVIDTGYNAEYDIEEY